MKKKLAVWVVGGLMTAAAFGVGVSPSVASAATKAPEICEGQQAMMGNMDMKAMAEMMKSPDMQKQCLDMLKSPEMQKAMIEVMKKPEMQGIMKKMLQQDMSFHQMMADLVNSVDMDSDHNSPQQEHTIGNSSNAHSNHH